MRFPGKADLLWASFPCQDLSLAGKGAGLAGKRSGMFKPFWNLVRQLHASGRGPKMIALENVYGAITSNGGRDFATLAAAFSGLGYRFRAVFVDAVHFLPQSRPRFFMIGVRGDLRIPNERMQNEPSTLWLPPALLEGHRLLSKAAAERWIWWNLPMPALRNTNLSGLIEEKPTGVKWHTKAETKYLLDMMTDHNRKKVEAAKEQKIKVVGTIYRRTRPDEAGIKRQRAEVRFDEIADSCERQRVVQAVRRSCWSKEKRFALAFCHRAKQSRSWACLTLMFCLLATTMPTSSPVMGWRYLWSAI